MLEPLEIPKVFSPDECRSVVATALAGDCGQAALVGGVRASTLRRAQTYWLSDMGDSAWVFNRMLKTLTEANRRHFDFQIEEFAEQMQVARYCADQKDFFEWHTDVGNGPMAARRKLTMVIQLSASESYVGGCLESNSNGSVRTSSREIGTALLLPSFVLHRVSPVHDGDRFSLTLWSHGPAFR